jgi:hypothetical protein
MTGTEEALERVFEQAGQVFGFTSMAGDSYRIDEHRCSPVIGSSGDEQTGDGEVQPGRGL